MKCLKELKEAGSNTEVDLRWTIYLVFEWKHSSWRTKRGRMGASSFFVMDSTKGPGSGKPQLWNGTSCTNTTRSPCCKLRDFTALKWLRALVRGVLLLKKNKKKTGLRKNWLQRVRKDESECPTPQQQFVIIMFCKSHQQYLKTQLCFGSFSNNASLIRGLEDAHLLGAPQNSF